MREIPQSLVRDLFDYDPETGVLTWRARTMKYCASERSMKSWNTKFAGKQAGRLYENANGYKSKQIVFFGKSYEYHRVVFAWMQGWLPEAVDHINRNPLDNRWCNLRASDWSRNARNKTSDRRNKTGTCGVWWDKSRRKYQAYVTVSGKRHNLGRFAQKEEAEMAVMEKRKELGFSDGHGEKRPY